MKRFILAPLAALMLTGCVSTTPEQTAAKVEAALEVVARWQAEGLVQPFDIPEKRLKRLVLACDAAFILSAGNDQAEAIYANFAQVCDLLRDAWIESQKPDPVPDDPAPVEAPMPVARPAEFDDG